MRPSMVLSGAGMAVAYHHDQLKQMLDAAVDVSPDHPVVISKFYEVRFVRSNLAIDRSRPIDRSTDRSFVRSFDRTGRSNWSIELVDQTGRSNWSIELVGWGGRRSVLRSAMAVGRSFVVRVFVSSARRREERDETWDAT